MQSVTRSLGVSHTGAEALHPVFEDVLGSLDRAGISCRIVEEPDRAARPGTMDFAFLVDRRDARHVSGILRGRGFQPIREASGGERAAFVSYHRPSDLWVLIRVYTRQTLARRTGRGFHPAWWDRALALVPPPLKMLLGAVAPRGRTGLTVALLGPDGSGKSSLAEDLERSYYFPVRRLYMGLWKEMGPPERGRPLPGWSLARRLITVWRQYLVGQYHRMRGRLVIFDRYAYDALVLPAGNGKRRDGVYAWLLGHACPVPDLVLVLDAPADVMYSRKRESNPERLEAERLGFLSLRRRFPRLTVVDATPPRDMVRADVTDLIWSRSVGR